jgi:hypothetical protein
VSAEEFDRLPKGAIVPIDCADRAIGQLWRDRGRFSGQRRQRRRKRVHRRRRRHQLADQRPLASGHGFRIPAGSAGQDDGHHGRIRRRARRRDQRGDQERRQHAPRRGHYFFLGSPLSAGPPKRLNLDPTDERTVRYIQDTENKDLQNEVGGSIGGPIVKDRFFFFGSYSPRFRRVSKDFLFSNGTEPGTLKAGPDLHAGVRQGDVFAVADGRLRFAALHAGRSTGNPPSYQGPGINYISSSKASNDVNITRGFEQDQINTSGSVDITLSGTSLLQVRGGYFYDNYKDTGVPNTISYTYQAPATAALGIPASLQGPIGTQNVQRILLNVFDKTERSFVNVDYNQTFSGAGIHTIKGGFGLQHTVNDVNKAYNGGSYVYLWWGQDFVFQGNRGRGAYGYYEVDNFGTQGKAGGDITSLYVQDQWTVGSKLTLNLGLRTEREIIPSFRPES